MSIYRPSNQATWIMDFQFHGMRICESTGMRSKTLAQQVYEKRKQSLREGAAGIKKRRQPLLLSVAAKEWFESKQADWSAANTRIERYNLARLVPYFGKMLLTDISADDINRYKAARKKANASNRTTNMEIGTLRAILKKNRLWENLQPDVRMLRVREDVGRAFTPDEQHRLLTAAKKNRSRSLYPAILLSLHTGLRNAELRTMRWRQVDLLERMITVGKSKTAGGEGRQVYLSDTALVCLKEWRSNFPDAKPSHYVFPSEKYGAGNAKDTGYLSDECKPYEVKPEVPIGTWDTAWTAVRKAAGVEGRWHDLRHSFVSMLAEGQASDATIMSLAGHLSRKMMERYSHIRREAKRQAIAGLDARTGSPTLGADGAENLSGSRGFPRGSEAAEEGSPN